MSTMTYRFVWPNSDEAKLTEAQITALVRIADRYGMCGTVEVSPIFGGNGAVFVDTGSMLIGVETDGYAHT